MSARVDRAGRVWRGVDRDGQKREVMTSWVAKPIRRRAGRPPWKPPFRINQILNWADRYHSRHSDWPKKNSGRIPESPSDTWAKVDQALRGGHRGLRRGSSLATLLSEQRGVRNLAQLPPLTVGKILRWADAYHDETGRWPRYGSGAIIGSGGETWSGVDSALNQGKRGLPGGSSLLRLLAKHRGVRNPREQPSLSVSQILAWADAWHARNGRWPHHKSGSIPRSSGETWFCVDKALRRGRRGLSGGGSLAALLAQKRGRRYIGSLPKFTVRQILSWADAHRRRTGAWPRETSGPIVDAPGETWAGVQHALYRGSRGLRGHTTIVNFLAKYRGVRNRLKVQRLTERLILKWADAHHARTAQWPRRGSGPIHSAADGDTWKNIDTALQLGSRGLPGGSSLSRLLTRRRGVLHLWQRPPLSDRQILIWAYAHRARTGQWPTVNSGAVIDCPYELWRNISGCLRTGGRGLRPGRSLARLLASHIRRPNHAYLHVVARKLVRGEPSVAQNLTRRAALPEPMSLSIRRPLSIEQILQWADAFFKRTGAWPTRTSGPIPETGETWGGINHVLGRGTRGLPAGQSLARLLAEHRGTRNRRTLPDFEIQEILRWADAFRERTGRWPTRLSGPISQVPGETWYAVESALANGRRGLPGGSSLHRLLVEQRGLRRRKGLPPLKANEIIAAARAHKVRTGHWPTNKSGEIPGMAGETWSGIDTAFHNESRGLRGYRSLADFLARRCGYRHHKNATRLTTEEILAWADAFHRRTGQWPKVLSGLIPEAPGERWANIDNQLQKGLRGLPAGDSLARLLARRRGVPIRERRTHENTPANPSS